jgi:hypothetical protein
MKLRDHPSVRHAQGSIVNQEIIRARAVTAELNIDKANELRQQSNLLTVRRLVLEIHRAGRNLTNH